MKVNEELSILVLPNNARKSKDGIVPLQVRLTLNLKRAVISLGQKVPENLWDQEARKMRGSTQEARLLNSAVDQCKVKLRQLYNSLELQGEEVTVETLKLLTCDF